jgi:hypothetical protein
MKHAHVWLLTALALSAASVSHAVPLVRSASGNAIQGPGNSIAATVDQFRLDLGNPNNGAGGTPFLSGRREINWDGGGATDASPVGTPFGGFQARGATFLTPGTGFTQAPIDSGIGNLNTINATYGGTFSFFSPIRVFTPLNSNITDVIFSEPGSAGAIGAATSGFGAVFSDVDLANTTSMEFFAFNGNSLGTFFVPPGAVPSDSLSFLGVSFSEGSIVGRVRITTGNAALGPTDSATTDVVVMDDFFFREPQRIPEPGILVLMVGALIGFALARKKRT